jgi:hypothetical protein
MQKIRRMRTTGEAKVKKDVLASGAKPKPEGRARERGRRRHANTSEIANRVWKPRVVVRLRALDAQPVHE